MTGKWYIRYLFINGLGISSVVINQVNKPGVVGNNVKMSSQA